MRCSLAAQGMWFQMLCLMHKGDPYGHLAFGGKGVKDEEIPGLISLGCNDNVTALQERYEDCYKALHELELAKIFSRNKKNIIYSRRMVRDEKEREQTRKRVQKHRDKGVSCNGNVTPVVTQMKRRSSSSSSLSTDLDPPKTPDPCLLLSDDLSFSKSSSDLRTEKGSPVPGGGASWLALGVSWKAFCSGCSWDKELQEAVLSDVAAAGLREHLEAICKAEDLTMLTEEQTIESWGLMNTNFSAVAVKRGKNLPIQIRGWCQNDLRKFGRYKKIKEKPAEPKGYAAIREMMADHEGEENGEQERSGEGFSALDDILPEFQVPD